MLPSLSSPSVAVSTSSISHPPVTTAGKPPLVSSGRTICHTSAVHDIGLRVLIIPVFRRQRHGHTVGSLAHIAAETGAGPPPPVAAPTMAAELENIPDACGGSCHARQVPGNDRKTPHSQVHPPPSPASSDKTGDIPFSGYAQLLASLRESSFYRSPPFSTTSRTISLPPGSWGGVHHRLRNLIPLGSNWCLR